MKKILSSFLLVCFLLVVTAAELESNTNSGDIEINFEGDGNDFEAFDVEDQDAAALSDFGVLPPVIIPRSNSTLFTQHFQSYNSRLFHVPYSYFMPNSAKQVSQALTYARLNRRRVTIKSGGHSCEALSSADNTVVIDMSKMKSTQIDMATRQIKVQSGLNWMEFYNTTVPLGLATAGGSCPTVNVGGLIGGGGANYLAPRYGYAVDNVVSMTVVTADGRIRNCSPNQHKDLFWAMRGAGHGGLGVIVDVTLQLHPIEPKLYRNGVKMTFDVFQQVLLFVDQYSRTMDQNIYMNMFAGMKVLTGPSSRYARCNFFYNGDPAVGDTEFRKFFGALQAVVPSVTTNFNSTPVGFVQILGGIADPPIARSYTRGRFMENWTPLTADLLVSMFDNTTVPVMTNTSDTTANIFFEMYFHGGQMQNKSRNFNAFVHRSAQWSASIALNYQSADNDQVFSTWDKKVAQKMTLFSKSIYQNYPDTDYPDWERAYYGENYWRLQLIKLKYDPFNFFNYTQSIRHPFA
ncbi:FAD dependent oxidoreductase domain-containing protein [Heterostelium album PN500]|uniref:FAD dependent oxidoreductase domain-containing protein n=1 Tax=Heterostelium pallidum (strain ATCC 26659 / Pp 5 / PN500) TaxID=670386 RepID=D3AYW3_HETP5|nr:FAD dependent oxidoreductase domain-containing protein [Heterostelium album PN500]EFA85653.1 FAD dependent oxidoreductase domain-containing protein [Heterostelium album PN500]|eukprot:XP_020437760.1 FAD dependent oxidoreductase domain-containing protein [Heterostelium album PN500]